MTSTKKTLNLKSLGFSAILCLIMVLGPISDTNAGTVTYLFSTADGFANGPLNGQSVFTAQTTFNVDTSGTGQVNSSPVGFNRFIAGANTICFDSLAINDSITLVMSDYTVSRNTSATGLQPNGAFGLTSGSNLGTAGVQVGLQLLFDDVGTGNIFLDDDGFANSSSPVDTGFNLGDTFDLTTVITKTNATTLTAVSTVGTASFTTGTFTGTGLKFGTIFQHQNPGPPNQGTGSSSFGSLSITTPMSPVPEPSSLLLASLSFAAVVGPRRRRRA